MDSKQGGTTAASANPNRVYEDFDPPFEWVKEEGLETLLVFLPGFQKERLKIQITSAGNLRINGERPLFQNKWRRFLKEFELERDCDTNKIAAKFEGGILYVKVPKPITTNTTLQPPKTAAKPKPSTSTPESANQLDNIGKKQQQQEVPQVPPPKPGATPIQKNKADVKTKDQKENIINAAEKKDVKESNDARRVPGKAIADHQKKDIKELNDVRKVSADKAAAAEKKDIKELNDVRKVSDKAVAEKKSQESTWPQTDQEKKTTPKVLTDEKSQEKARSNVDGSDKPTGKEIFKGLPGDRENKISTRTWVNLALAVLFVGVLALYVRNAFRSFGSEDESSEL